MSTLLDLPEFAPDCRLGLVGLNSWFWGGEQFAVTNMEDRNVSWLGTISEKLMDHGPVAFSRELLSKQKHLFAHRSSLFYTPTENLPDEQVGTGPLEVSLPLATPDYNDCFEVRAYMSPRLWVDLVQRHTGKLRWTPITPAKVTIVRYDYVRIRSDHMVAGVKGLLDALKVGTTGRRDRIFLHYFGAILDDGPEFIKVRCDQRLVRHPKDACMKISVWPQLRWRLK